VNVSRGGRAFCFPRSTPPANGVNTFLRCALRQFHVRCQHTRLTCPLIRNIRPISWTLVTGIWETSVNSKHYANFVYSCHWNLGDVREFKTLRKFRVPLSVETGRRPRIQNITQISCTLITGIWETSANSKHYTNFVYPCQWNLGDVREFKTLHQFRVPLSMESGRRPRIQNITQISCTLVSGIWETSANSKHYTNIVYPCQWNLGVVREFKTLRKFRVPLSVESGRRPRIQNITPISCTLVTGIWETSVNSNITPISCTLVNGIWETSANSKHYTNFVYPFQWNLGVVREFKTLCKLRVPLSVESGRRPRIENITQISCTLVSGIWETSANSKHYTNFVYPCQWNLGDVREFKTLSKFRVPLSVESGRRP